jgi:bifunctional non-homologous end joining protein LigD
VRTAVLASDRVVPRRLIGGSLASLLFTTHKAALSQDPWFSRVQSEDTPDHCVLDLDPMPGVPFAAVVDVARWVRDELEALGVTGFPKTSGKTGLHVYVPLARGTTYAASRLFAEIVATAVAGKHPRVATVERALRGRGRRVYVDFLQNSRGKTLASAYSARGSEDAGVSTPLTWAEVDAGVDRRDFTLLTAEARLRKVGDLWAAFRRARGVDLAAVVSGRTARSPRPPRAPRSARRGFPPRGSRAAARPRARGR